MTDVVVIRHGPFYSDPRVVKECLALAEVPGVTVEVLTRGPEVERWIARPNLRITALGAGPPSGGAVTLGVQAVMFGLRAAARLARRAHPPDAVVVHSIPSWLLLLVAPALGRRSEARLILDHHEPEAEMLEEAGSPRALVWLTRRMEARALRRADAVVDVSEAMADRSARLGARKQVVVDNAPRLFARPRSNGEAGCAHDLEVFGSLIGRYDLPVLRAALARVDRPVDVLQVGVGPDRLTENPSGGALLSLPFLPPPELQEALARCRLGFVGLAASRFTELVSPNRMWELSGLGIPSLVARTSLLAETLGREAFYYRGGSAESLSAALVRALEMSPGERCRVGDRARERLSERAWSAQADSFVDLVTGADPLTRASVPA